MIARLARCIALAAALCGPQVHAAPFRPANDAVVVATLPGALNGRPSLVAASSGAPDLTDPVIAAAMARSLIERARREGDPRDLGRAQAVLERWVDPATAPIDILVLQATVAQSLHRFDEAHVVLDTVLRRKPGDTQALLTRAVISQVQGRLDDASRDCASLARSGAALTARTCAASVASLQGRGRAAYVMLDFSLQSAGPQQDTRLLIWIHSVLAGIAERNADFAAARTHYESALELDPRDRYVRGAYADFLLDRGDAAAAQALTEDHLADDSLLLRQGIARDRLGRADSAATTRMLAERFDAARRRGDSLHLREEARFELLLRHDARSALELARRNWALPQREPEDARILLEAAISAGDRGAERMARAWFGHAGVADGYLESFDQGAAVQLAQKARP